MDKIRDIESSVDMDNIPQRTGEWDVHRPQQSNMYTTLAGPVTSVHDASIQCANIAPLNG